HIGSSVNGGEPYCEDFNELMICAPYCDDVRARFGESNCAGGSLNNACAVGSLNFPTFNTVCGNGIKDAYEDCDCRTTFTGGAAPAPATVAACGATGNGGTVCSTVCRYIN